MSHYSVAVFTDSSTSVDELLAPYEEGAREAMYLDWASASVSMEEIIAKFNEEKNDNETLKQFVKRWYGYDYNPARKEFGFMCNTSAKWDWYEIGGRFSGIIRKTNGEECDSALVAECDFSPDQEEYESALRYWELVVEGAEKETNEQFLPGLFGPQYYIDHYGDKENYAKKQAQFSTYAFISADGQWHAPGNMGWFACDDADKDSMDTYYDEFSAYLEEARKLNLTMTIVDCHI